jgi:iodotyrosine deiodinase
MAFKKLNFKELDQIEMIQKSKDFLSEIRKRRSVREFSSKNVPIDIVKNAIKVALSAPSGANKQPWHFVLVKNKKVKKKIRTAAEKEEKKFYNYRASDDWLKDLNQFRTDWKKPFLEEAPYLIAVFKEVYDLDRQKKRKNYYVNESVGISCGFLIMALHDSGLACLPHTPSPMGFLEQVLKRPKNERAYLLVPTGLPSSRTSVPKLNKKEFNKVCSIK